MSRRRTKVALVALSFAFSSACAGPTPSNLPAGQVLHFGVGHREGSVSLDIQEDGTVEYSVRQAGADDKHVKTVVPREDVTALVDELRKHDFCSLRSQREKGVPDEARPSIKVRAKDLDCTVELWDNEFRESPRAHHCLQLLQAFGRKIGSKDD